jgi:hypothetical protein
MADALVHIRVSGDDQAESGLGLDDLHTAYRRLDFSDITDPMHVVKVQMRKR